MVKADAGRGERVPAHSDSTMDVLLKLNQNTSAPYGSQAHFTQRQSSGHENAIN